MTFRIRLLLFLSVLFLSVLFLCGCAELIQPRLTTEIREISAGEYILDKEHVSLVFKVDHMGLSKYIGRFNGIDAGLQFDPDNISAAKLEAIVDMTSVDVNNEKLERALRGRFWFDTDNHPQAFFTTTMVTRNPDGTLLFTGNLTFLGVTEEVDVQVVFNGAGNNLLTGRYTLGFTAHTVLQRSAFGLDRFIPVVGDKVELEVHAEFQRRLKQASLNSTLLF